MKRLRFKRKNKSDELLELMFIGMILFVGYIVLFAPERIKASNVPPELKQSNLGLLQLEIEANRSGYETDKCQLSFYSERYEKEVVAPSWFMDRIAKYDSCKDKQWLIRLAHYESDFNENAVNGNFSGLWQVGKVYPNLTSQDSTLGWCTENGHGGSDEECVLWLVDWNPHTQFEVVDRYINSFKDLL